MAKKRKLSYKKVIRFVVCLLILLILCVVAWYKINLSKVSNNDNTIEFEVTNNDTFSSISSKLKNNNLIKNELVYKIYLKLNKVNNLQIGIYPLNSNMSVKQIVNALSGNPDESLSHMKITFPEGINMRKFASILEKNTQYKADDLYNLLKDNNYLDELINKYWFISKDIKNSNIYYSLEGYLYPDTYEFKKHATLKEIIETILNNTSKKLESYKSSIQNSKYSVHEILTLASVVELEASTNDDRKGVAGVFINRLNSNMGLESDVTTYYGLKKELTESIAGHVYGANAYNTRSTTLYGKLPVGPICNMSTSSIDAILNPTTSNYYYFVADTNKKVYFAKNYNEHLNIIAKLKKEGIWNA